VLWVEDVCKPHEARVLGAEHTGIRAGTRPPDVWLVLNKTDLAADGSGHRTSEQRNEYKEYNIVLHLSALAGDGFNVLLDEVARFASSYFGTESALVTRERHRSALEQVVQALGRALAEPAGREDIVAEELRRASHELGRLTGRVDVEDVLDVIFRDFCIGK
jgi:tRNA modification GTPase